MLRISDIDVFRGATQVIQGLNLEVAEGQVVALLGRNGSGKSTVLDTIMGIVPARRGQIEFRERSIARLVPQVIARRGIGYMPDTCRLFPDLTVMQNIRLGRLGRRKGVPEWTRDKLLKLFPTLDELKGQRASQIDGADRKLVALARALCGNPRLLLLDEPAECLNSLAVQEMAETINFLREEGLTILLADQNLRFAAAVADWAYVLDAGNVVVEGDMEQLAAHDKIWQEFLAA